MGPYPDEIAARDRFVLDRRPPRLPHDPWRPHGVVVEDERTADGAAVETATIFLTGRECPWRCAMCDLWQYTTTADTPAGAISVQLRRALGELGPPVPPVLKLYNAGSFFDARAVPPSDYADIATALRPARQVVVESHPALVGARTTALLDTLASAGSMAHLEVAMGLETCHPVALERLHKRMTLDDFAAAAGRLHAMGASLRVFLLVSPPFVPAEAQDEWLVRSVVAAVGVGASVVSLIPTRPGNGALEALAEDGHFRPPVLADVERSLLLALRGIAAAPGTRAVTGTRVFADLWDLERCSTCAACFDSRRDRLHRMNLEQRVLPSVQCDLCDNTDATPAGAIAP